MVKSRVTQGKRAPKARVEKPVSEGIRRAAQRAGIDPPRDGAATGEAELASLRIIAASALAEFDATGVSNNFGPAEILKQALLCVDGELDVVTDASSLGEKVVEPMVFVRMRRRIQLAIELADHRRRFGAFHDIAAHRAAVVAGGAL